MAHSARGDGTKVLLLRLSVPAQGSLRAVATEFATRLAAHLGSFDGAEAAGLALDTVAERVAPVGSDGNIVFEFTEDEGELLIRARCDGRSSEARHPLPDEP